MIEKNCQVQDVHSSSTQQCLFSLLSLKIKNNNGYHLGSVHMSLVCVWHCKMELMYIISKFHNNSTINRHYYLYLTDEETIE